MDKAHLGELTQVVLEPGEGEAIGVGRVTAVSLLQPSVTSTTSSNSRPAMRLGYMGAARHVEGRRGVGSAHRDLHRSDGKLGQ
jgi:hypothetical protein